ncbi:AMP-binding protein [Streptomyces sp. NPDC057638]|uniref:AMP-binding protein n=1 Tax=Streptomyces sp. NPDC057638 TaxID=3346190 RepID=UPI0036C48453
MTNSPAFPSPPGTARARTESRPGLTAIVHGHGHRQGTVRAMVEDGRTPLTWAAATATVQRIAELLRTAGIGSGHTVALATASGPAYLLALLGTLAAGAAPVDASPEVVAEGWPAHLDGLAPAAVVADHLAGEPSAPALPGVRLWLSTTAVAPPWAAPWPAGTRPQDVVPGPRPQAAGVMYRVSRGGTVYRWDRGEFTRALLGRSPWRPRTRAEARVRLLLTSGLRTVWGQARALEVLAAGGTLIFPPPGETTASGLWDVAAQNGATAVEMTGDRATAMASALAARGPQGLSALKTLITSGALCPARTKETLLGMLPGRTVLDRYETAEHHLLAESAAGDGGDVPPSGFFPFRHPGQVLTPGGRPAILAEDGTLTAPRPHAQGVGANGPIPGGRLRPGPGGAPPLCGDPARLHSPFEVLLGLPRPVGEAVLDATDVASAGRIAAILLSHPHVTHTAVVTLEHPARGRLPAALVVLTPDTDPETGLARVAAHARTHLPDRLTPHALARVTALPDDGLGRLNLARARDILQTTAADPGASAAPVRRAPAERWDDLVLLAQDEQDLLAQALTAVLSADAAAQLSRYLDYPHGPRPLAGMTTPVPHFLQPCADEVGQYLDHLRDAVAAAFDAIGRYGWPDARRYGPRAAHAAWLLLQHADVRNGERALLLPLVARAVTEGRADPRHLALLTDRTLVESGEPQKYGTFALRGPRRVRFLYHLADHDMDRADHHRTAIGLPTLADDLQPGRGPLLPCGPGWATEGPRRQAVFPPDPDARPSAGPWHRHTPARPAVPHGAAPVHVSAAPRHHRRATRYARGLPDPLHSTATWLEHTPTTSVVAQFDAGPAAAQSLLRLRAGDIARSRLLIVLHDPADPGLTTSETAGALSSGMPVVVTGADTGFPLLGHPGLTTAPTPDDALRLALAWARP